MVSPVDFSRQHADPYADGPPLAVDRQRIIHAAAFRRLQYKTQVFLAAGGHFRTRLTHTLEVAHLAGRLATALGLDAELAEAAALAHDLGHPPFGHAGERALDECLAARGDRFDHNEQTLRVVSLLEHPYPAFRGLNLTAAVRACLQTHATRYDRTGREPPADPPLEGQVVALADELAYALHDLQDGLHAGLLSPGQAMELALWREHYGGPPRPGPADCLRHLRPTVERIQATLIADVKAEYERRRAVLTGPSGTTPPGRPVELSPNRQAQLRQLQELLHTAVYCHPRVREHDERGERLVRRVFAAYLADPRQLPPRFGERVAAEGTLRVVTDYVAGMTDGFCEREHARLCGAKTAG